MSTKPTTLNLEKFDFLDESKRLYILLFARIIDHDQVVKGLKKCEATFQVFQDVTKKNSKRLKKSKITSINFFTNRFRFYQF
jgi:hypothetical protein